MKQKVFDKIEENKDLIFEIGDTVLKNPELGFKEYKTAELVKKVFEKLGIPYRDNLAITGIKATLKGRSHKRNDRKGNERRARMSTRFRICA